MTTETATLNGRTMTFGPSGIDHLTSGEGIIAAKYFDVKPGEVFFDVGAADSMWTLYALASGAFVYAFEPSVPRYKVLVEEVLLNPGFFERCKLNNVGLDRQDCVKTLGQWYADMGGDAGLELTPDCLVPTRFLPMDHYLPELTRLDWIKIDVEAGEYFVMQGGAKAIRRFRPNMIIENHANIVRMGDWMRENEIERKIADVLAELDYEVVEEPFQGRSFIVATRRAG